MRMATRNWSRALAGWVAALTLAAPGTALAHKGPPFPIVLDEPVAEGLVVSVWADPDIGEAQFFIILEKPGGGMPEVVPEVEMWTEPESGRLERATWPAERAALRNQLQFEAQPWFDIGDFWTVGFRIRPPGAAQAGEVRARVESTPPGYGPWDLAIYLFPFVFLGGFFALAWSRRAKIARLRAEQAAAASAQKSETPRSRHQ